MQRKVIVGSPGDAAEHEANRVADQVANGSSSAKPTISRLQTLQRKSSETSDAERAGRKAEEDRAPVPVQRAEAGGTTEPKKKQDHAPTAVQRAEAGGSTEPKKEEDHTPAPVQRAEASSSTEPKKEGDHAPAPVQRAEASSSTEPKKEGDHAPAPVQRAEASSSTEPKKQGDHTPAPVQRAEASSSTEPKKQGDHTPAPVQRAEASSSTEPKKEGDHAPAAVQRAEASSSTEPKKEGDHTPAAVQRAEASSSTEPKKEGDHAPAAVQRAEASSSTEPKKEGDHAPAAVQRAEASSSTEPKKEGDHTPAAVQRAEAISTTEPEARKKEEKTEASVQRAEAHETMSDATAQRCCCCGERGGQNEQQQPAERPSGTASVYCKLHDQTPSSSENELNHSVRRKEAVGKPAGDLDAAATHAVATKDAGAPLRPHVLQKLELRMGVDLSGVRVHEGSAAQESAAALQARAFTHKGDIWLGKGESQENTNLMAHEATHVVQQGAAVSRSSFHSVGRLADGPKNPDEEQATGVPTVRRSVLDQVTGAVGAAWDATGGKLLDAAGNAIAMGADFFWKMVKSLAPAWIVDLIQAIREKGILGYLKDKLSGAFKGVFGGLSNTSGFIPGPYSDLQQPCRHCARDHWRARPRRLQATLRRALAPRRRAEQDGRRRVGQHQGVLRPCGRILQQPVE